MSVYDRINDRTRPCETVWDPYIRPYLKSTPRVSQTVPRSYINCMKSFETVPKSYIQHPTNIWMLHDHGIIHSSAHMVSYDRHTTKTVQVRIIHGRPGMYGYTRSHTALHGLTRSLRQHELCNENHNWLLPPSNARSIQCTCCIKLECIKRRSVPRAEGCKKGHQGPPTTPTLWPCRAWLAGWPTNVYQSCHDFLFPYPVICCIWHCLI
jgi:hypothetical protein